MPIEGTNWDTYKRGMHVHVLAGTTSPDLRVDHLRFHQRMADTNLKYPFAKTYLDSHSDVTLTFTIADASVPPGTSTRSFASHGITVDGATGAVTVASTLTDPFPRNFVLEVQAVSGSNTYRELIRVSVHRHVSRIWLTPDPLNVRPRASPTSTETLSRFAVRAEFDDGEIGDITDWLGITWSPSRNVTSKGRLKVEASDTPGSNITITAALTSDPSISTTGTMHVLRPWSAANPIETRLVPGGGYPDPFWSNPFAIEAVPNVLFLPDGFPDTNAAKSAFYSYVNSLVGFLKRDPLCKPFDKLAHSINFWAAFIGSPQGAITWGSELHTARVNSSTWASTVDPPMRGQDATEWGTGAMRYELGLPLPRDALSNTARTNAMIMAEWDAVFGTHYRSRIGSTDAMRNERINNWRELADRTILDDVNTPLGITSGRPRVDDNHNTYFMNRDRMDRKRLDDLMSALRHDRFAESALRLDTLWVDKTKLNYDLVCIITPNEGRAVNAGGYFIVNQAATRDLSSGPGALRVELPTIRSTANSSESRLFAHELSHSFSLGDEYGGSDKPLTQAQIDRANRYYPNLQSPTSVQRGGRIHGDEIKWRWPRIRWAAELIETIVSVGGGRFEARVRASHAFAFPIGEIVHLRFRDIHHGYRDVPYGSQTSYLIKEPKVSVPLRLVERLERGSPTEIHIRLEVATGVTFPYPSAQTVAPAQFIATFVPGSIVYQPRRAPSGVFNATSYPYAELIAKNVKDFITTKGAVVGRSNTEVFASSLPEIPDFTGLSFPDCWPTGTYPLIVALYEGGIGNNTGIHHPTGDCMMNDQSSGSRFCHVCKYMLVDIIDPSKHLFIDRDYDDIYPQR